MVALTSQPIALEADSVGDNQIIMARAGKKVRLYGLVLTFTAPVEVIVRNGPDVDLSGPMALGPGSELVLNQASQPWFETSPNQPLVLNLSAECAVAGTALFAYA